MYFRNYCNYHIIIYFVQRFEVVLRRKALYKYKLLLLLLLLRANGRVNDEMNLI